MANDNWDQWASKYDAVEDAASEERLEAAEAYEKAMRATVAAADGVVDPYDAMTLAGMLDDAVDMVARCKKGLGMVV